ncbi:DUF3667 domain-containing protein [Panacibacter ginsenosidivorans]|uniref:DUF3667 domain-containing protein n=1 Tax=Panacibacter ginsenosidivorans TaxID=1813871 RepID=A0A5B8V7C3_9BACT|nr:DUF3667 domain-containing protein [Panacibacter ginsenosidivorans]QEC67222.1 DUF3667 domain-containing protein [Panacibacter ginsenosidivorans]
MSHLKERKEKNCLNCNAEVQGKYCHICGQENIEPKETFWMLATHFAYDILHFDGKFFSTLKYLLLKPGFLSHEYLRGRRASYLHPIRMYVFTSAIFFIIFFSFIVKPDEIAKSIGSTNSPLSEEHVNTFRDSLSAAYAKTTDSVQKQKIEKLLNAIDYFSEDTTNKKTDSLHRQSLKDTAKIDLNNKAVFRVFGDKNLPETEKEYDSIQNALPKDQRDGWFKSIASKWAIGVNNKYKENPDDFKKDFIEKFFHSVPQVMFVTLPLIALFMQLLYIRKRRQVFYVNHVIFLTHVYIALFIGWLITFGIGGLYEVSGWEIFTWLNFLVGTYMFIYTPWAMKNFYEQGIAKSVFKYFILLFAAFILFTIVFGVFAIKSAM